MNTLILIGSIIGILNSFILIVYALVTKKGNRKANIIFALFILMLTLRISKSILLTFSDGLHDLLLTLGLSGFLAIGPTYLFYTEAILKPKYQFKWKQLLHLFPAIIFTFMWVYLDYIRNDSMIWHLFYRAILLQYMIYLTAAIYKTWNNPIVNPNIKRQLNIISIFLLAIWFAYLLNEVAGFPYISGAILYSVLIYFSLIIILNKGYVINLSNPKYKNTGLDSAENQRILRELNALLEKDKVFKNNIISLAKLSKLLNTNIHALSQVINENKQQTFFEMISFYRVEEAKHILSNSSNSRISDVAFEVGYNSLSAFNAAFKKSTGETPKKYKSDQNDS